MTTRINIAIDVMGSDKGPETIIEASSISKTRYPEIKYTYFGDSKLISKYVKKFIKSNYNYDELSNYELDNICEYFCTSFSFQLNETYIDYKFKLLKKLKKVYNSLKGLL